MLFEERLYDKKNFSEGRYDIRKAIERWLIRRYTVVVVVLLLCSLLVKLYESIYKVKVCLKGLVLAKIRDIFVIRLTL